MPVKSLDIVSPYLLHHRLDVEDDIVQHDNFSNILAKVPNAFSNPELEAVKKAIAKKNATLCELLIKHYTGKSDPSYLKQTIDLPEVFDMLLNECAEPEVILETLYEVISRGNLSLIKKIIDKYHHHVSLNTWQDTWKTNNTIMQKCLEGKINLEIVHYLVKMGFTTRIDLLRRFVNTNNAAATHSLISAGVIQQFDQTKMQSIFNTLLRRGHISSAEAVRQLMTQKGYKFVLRLGKGLKSLTVKPLLMRVPLSKVYDVVSYAIPYCKYFNLIKDGVYENDGRRSLPETVLSYLAFVKQFDAMKLVIENPDCSFTPCHLVACSLFRGHHTSRHFKLPLPIYDEIFDYLMRDDIRPRVLGDDKVWIDKSIFIAIRYGNERMVMKLVELGADLTNVFITSRHNYIFSAYARYSLLSYACEYQTTSLVEFLIEKGVPVDGTMIDALGEPMIEAGNTDMNDNEDYYTRLNHDDDGNNDDGGNDDIDEADVNKADDDNELDMKHRFHFSSDRFDQIPKSLYPKYFNLPKINRNRDLGSSSQFSYRKRESKNVYLLNMTPLGVAIYKQKADIVKILLLHGANPMGKCMVDFPALFCLSHTYVKCLIRSNRHDVNEETDDEIIERYPLKKRNHNDNTTKRPNPMYTRIEPVIDRYHSHFVTTLSETISCVNIKSFLATYSHQLDCGLHESDPVGPKRQRRHELDRVEVVNMPIQTTTVTHATTPAIATAHSPPSSNFIYRNNNPEVLQLLVEYGAPAVYDTQKLGVEIPCQGLDSLNNVEYTIKYLFTHNMSWAGYGANMIIMLAKLNMVSLEKLDELINLCFEAATIKVVSNTEKVMNVCELLSAIIYPVSDNFVKSSTSLSTFDQKVALTSGILDSEYSDKLYDIAIDKIYDYYDSNIEVFMRFTKAYPQFFYLNMQHSSGKSLLHHSNVAVAYNLVQLGLDLNYCTPLGDSLLLQTIKNVNAENIEIIYRLIIFGADINTVGIDGVNCEQAMQKSSYSQSLKDFMRRCARIMELLDIMNQYQSDKCVCLRLDDNGTTCNHTRTIKQSGSILSATPPFSRDDYDLIASSCVPEYTYDTLSYFFSVCSSNSTPAVCVTCNNTLSKNDHCRPYQVILSSEDQNGLSTTTYIHDKCFFRNLNTMVVDCNAKSMETGFPRYIRNPSKRYSVPNI